VTSFAWPGFPVLMRGFLRSKAMKQGPACSDAEAIVAPGKGILAATESSGTIANASRRRESRRQKKRAVITASLLFSSEGAINQ